MIRSIPREGIQIKLAQAERLVIVDVRSVSAFERAHLPHAYSIPLSDLLKDARSFIPNLGAEVVVYGSSVESKEAQVGCEILKEVGFTNVYCYWGGFADWVSAGFPTDSVFQQAA